MSARRIEDFATIGDCETAALVGRDGSIEWLCWPNFASNACFASLVRSSENGHWSLAPTGKQIESTRRHRPHTLVLETMIRVATGTIVLTEFMPLGGNNSDLVRIVRCKNGRVTMQMELCPRFHYGSTVPWITSLREASGTTAWLAKADPRQSASAMRHRANSSRTSTAK
jgi:GH15 family glucan-1,4-alpha-glucosidase